MTVREAHKLPQVGVKVPPSSSHASAPPLGRQVAPAPLHPMVQEKLPLYEVELLNRYRTVSPVQPHVFAYSVLPALRKTGVEVEAFE